MQYNPYNEHAALGCDKIYMLQRTRGRVLLLALIFILVSSCIYGRLLFLSMSGVPDAGIFNFTSAAKVRPDILDRNGAVLATSLPIYSAFARPYLVANKLEAASQLAKITSTDSKAVLKKLTSPDKFVWIKRNLTPKQVEKIRKLGIQGIEFEENHKRVYSYGNLLSHVLGYVNVDNGGLAGMERYHENKLPNNQPITTSLDVEMQSIVSQALDESIKEFNAKGAAGVVIDPNNGEILAIVSKPDFDPHNPAKAGPNQMFNRSSLGLYEFGSVFKILTMAIAIDTKVVKSLEQQYNIDQLQIGKYAIKDYTPSKGLHTVASIFAKSSNKGTGKIALEVGQEEIQRYLRALKLDSMANAQIHEKASSSFGYGKKWSDISTVTVSYGYGFATSVLNLLQAIVPVVNGGIMYPLTLFKTDDTNHGERVFSSSTSDAMNQLLRLVVTSGTGKKADIPGYDVGGKSGTANKIKGGKYDKNSRISNFVAVFPTEKPQYLIYVMLDEPKPTAPGKTATGGVTAAKAVSQIISGIVSLKSILPVEHDKEYVNIKQNSTISLLNTKN